MKGMSHPAIFRLAAELPKKNEYEAALESLRTKHPAVVLSHNGRGQACWHCLACGQSRVDKEKLRRLRCR